MGAHLIEFRGDAQATKRPVACFKYGCSSWATTWELEVGGESPDAFPNALCARDARSPDKTGTIDRPTLVVGGS